MSQASEVTTLPEWALVEVMGHQTVAGRCSEVRVCGTTMLQVEPPDRRAQILGAAAIFRITPCTEDEARLLATRSAETITPWMLGQPMEDIAFAGHSLKAGVVDGEWQDHDDRLLGEEQERFDGDPDRLGEEGEEHRDIPF